MADILEKLKSCPMCGCLCGKDFKFKNQWISVDDKLPEDVGDCLVWYRCDTAFGKSESWGIAACSRGEWYTKHLHGDNIVVLYWQPLPEIPEEAING